jgi:hypothetical protein
MSTRFRRLADTPSDALVAASYKISGDKWNWSLGL